MKKVTILAFDSAPSTTITGPLDVFSFAGASAKLITEGSPDPYFDVQIASPDGAPVQCANQVTIASHLAMHEVKDPDLIVIAGVWDLETVLSQQKETFDWLREQHDRGAHIASVCTGSFVLAATGLLDGKEATTHWGAADVFRQLFPKVNLKPERLIVDTGELYCAGAFTACYDLSLYLVAKYVGYDVAAESAKTLIHDIGRISQTPYSSFNFQRNHTDDCILQTQQTLEKKYSDDVDIDNLAQEAGMCRRTFERRFKNATGNTPLQYLQKVRVERAKQFLEEKNSSFDEVSYDVGYENSSFFRKIFRKHTGLRPTEYRHRFQRKWNFQA
ncbi:MAG: helix-turn-helix domain-containing protein [Desulfocapsa sp.]|nr:helix-turn-helix domain-containing protein [Desulfocapsa sp.]